MFIFIPQLFFSLFALFGACGFYYQFGQMEPADPDFYRIGYKRSVRAYGVEFMEGPNGFGVYASRDVEPLRRARVSVAYPYQFYYNGRIDLKLLTSAAIYYYYR